MSEQFKEFQRRVKVLDMLISDPQPGLAAWCEEYIATMEWITEYWRVNGIRKKEGKHG